MSPPSTVPDRPDRRLAGPALATGLVALALAAACAAALPALFGAPEPMVEITWRQEVVPAERQALEQRYRLSEATLRSDTVWEIWSYVPLDRSAAALRALADEPAVLGTDGIDRRTFRIGSNGPLTGRRGGIWPGHPQAARAWKLLEYLLAGIAGLALAAAGAVTRFPELPATARRAWHDAVDRPDDAARRVLAALQRGVPVVSARGAGWFRITFVTATLALVVASPLAPGLLDPAAVADAVGPYGAVARWLAGHLTALPALQGGLVLAGLLAAAGAVTWLSYPLYVAGALVWGCAHAVATTHHAIVALLLTMVCLLPARWSDALSVDAWLARRRGSTRAPAAGRAYGFATWVPVAVFGVTFLAAAWSKVRGGPAWILNGTVKYHFLTDLDRALVPWGPLLTRAQWVAVLLSGGAVAVEAVLIWAAFTRSPRVRAGLGAMAALLLVNIALFQGVFWPAWWILFLGFLPWSRVAATGAPAPPAAGGWTRAQTAVVALLVVQQIAVSTAQVELRPLLSAYDMYSATYADANAYALSTNLVYRVLDASGPTPATVPDCVVDDRTAARFRAAAEAGTPLALGPTLAHCGAAADRLRAVSLEGDRRIYDWEAGTFSWERALDRIGPVAVVP